MPTREERRVEAEKHVGLVRGVFEGEVRESIASAAIYEDGDGREIPLEEPRYDQTDAQVIWDAIANTIASAPGKACVVDPASYRVPGGNYLAGGWTPEAQICAESTLYPVLESLKEEYFEANGQSTRGGLFTDRAVYLTDIVFTTGGSMKKRDVLVIAPPNRGLALQNQRSEAECDMDLRNRIEALMRIAADHQVDTLVVDAFGCGFYDNDPHAVAGLFKDWIEMNPGQFQQVLFAIAGGPALDAFREAFPEKQAEQPAEEPAAAGREGSDDEGQTDVAQTSDGRWVFD